MSHCGNAPIIFSSLMAITIIAISLREEISVWLSQLNIIYMLKLIYNPLFWIIIFGVVLFYLLATTIRLLRQYNKHINTLNKKIEAFSPTSKLEIEVHSIKTFVEIIAYVAVAFCLGIAIHYMAIELPRVLDAKYQNSHIQNLGVDYLGLIVAIFAIIVTVLVTWQIFSTIRAKDELKELQRENKDFRNQQNNSFDALKNEMQSDYKDKLVNLQDCCNSRITDITEINKRIDNIANGALLIMSSRNLLQSLHDRINPNKSDLHLISIAYSSTMRALLQLVLSKTTSDNIRGCLSELKSCLLLFWDKGKFDKAQYDISEDLYNQIHPLLIDAELRLELEEVYDWQKRISWDVENEKMHQNMKKFQDLNQGIDTSPTPRN